MGTTFQGRSREFQTFAFFEPPYYTAIWLCHLGRDYTILAATMPTLGHATISALHDELQPTAISAHYTRKNKFQEWQESSRARLRRHFCHKSLQCCLSEFKDWQKCKRFTFLLATLSRFEHIGCTSAISWNYLIHFSSIPLNNILVPVLKNYALLGFGVGLRCSKGPMQRGCTNKRPSPNAANPNPNCVIFLIS